MHKTDAIYVAQLIGLDLVESFEQLPVGFRLNWQDAASQGYFSKCLTIGDHRRAYCRFLARLDD